MSLALLFIFIHVALDVAIRQDQSPTNKQTYHAVMAWLCRVFFNCMELCFCLNDDMKAKSHECRSSQCVMIGAQYVYLNTDSYSSLFICVKERTLFILICIAILIINSFILIALSQNLNRFKREARYR
jgi:hypothetical protein